LHVVIGKLTPPAFEQSTMVATGKLPHTMRRLYFPMQNWLNRVSQIIRRFLPEPLA